MELEGTHDPKYRWRFAYWVSESHLNSRKYCVSRCGVRLRAVHRFPHVATHIRRCGSSNPTENSTVTWKSGSHESGSRTAVRSTHPQCCTGWSSRCDIKDAVRIFFSLGLFFFFFFWLGNYARTKNYGRCFGVTKRNVFGRLQIWKRSELK